MSGILTAPISKYVAVEVPAIATVDEAWEMVETSEKTKKHCYMMENCCYDFFELLTLNMARQEFFGDIIHADAAAWSVIIPLSEKLVSNRSKPVDIPNFTRGAWRTNQALKIS